MRRFFSIFGLPLIAAAAGAWVWFQPVLPAWFWLPPLFSVLAVVVFLISDRQSAARTRLARWVLFCFAVLGFFGGLAGMISAIARDTLFTWILSLPLNIDKGYHFRLAAGPVWMPGFLALAGSVALARGSFSWSWWNEPLHEQWRRTLEKKRPQMVREGSADIVIGIDADTKQPIVLQEQSRTMHMLVSGPTGSGKTMGVLHPCVAQDIANPEVGVTVIEPKGDWIGLNDALLPEDAVPGVLALAERYGRSVYLVDPTRESTDVINPLSGELGPVLETNVAMFNALFGSQQAFFALVEATVLKNFIRLLKYLKGNNVTYLDLMGLLRDPERVLGLVGELAAQLKIEFSPPEYKDGKLKEGGALGRLSPETDHRHELLQWFVYDYFHHSSASQWREHSLGLRTLFDKLFSNLDFLRCVIPRPGVRVVDFDRHLEEKSVLLVPTNDGVLGELSQVLGVLVAMNLQFAVMRRGSYEFIRSGKPKPLHVLYMDEFSTYVTKEFVGFLEKARGMNCATVLGFQSIGQLEKAGAQIGIGRAFRNVIVDQCGTKIVYGRLGPDDVEFWTRLFGTRKEKEESRSEMHRRDAAQVVPDSVSISTSVRETDTEYFSYNDVRFQEENRFVYELLVGRSLQRARRGIARPLRIEDVPPKRFWDTPPSEPESDPKTPSEHEVSVEQQEVKPELPDYLAMLHGHEGNKQKSNERVSEDGEEESGSGGSGGGDAGSGTGGREGKGGFVGAKRSAAGRRESAGGGSDGRGGNRGINWDDTGRSGSGRSGFRSGGRHKIRDAANEAEEAGRHEAEDWDATLQDLRDHS